MPNHVITKQDEKKDNEKKFWGFTSTSTDEKLFVSFFNEREIDGKREGTKFIIYGDVVGYDIVVFSCFPEESEVLIEPERTFKLKKSEKVI